MDRVVKVLIIIQVRMVLSSIQFSISVHLVPNGNKWNLLPSATVTKQKGTNFNFASEPVACNIATLATEQSLLSWESRKQFPSAKNKLNILLVFKHASLPRYAHYSRPSCGTGKISPIQLIMSLLTDSAYSFRSMRIGILT